MRTMACLMFLIVGFLPAVAQARSDLGLTFKGTWEDLYLFRGRMLHDDAVVHGEVGVGVAAWSYNLLYTETDDNNALLETEYNHQISFTTAVRNQITTVGYNFFDYNGLLPDTQEFFFRMSSQGRRWNTNYGVTYDFDTYKGYFIDLALSRLFPLSRRSSFLFTLQGAGAFELDEERRRGEVIAPGFYEDDGLTYGLAELRYVLQPARWFKVEAGAFYHYAFDDALYDDITIDQDQTVIRASVTITLP